MKCPDCGGTIPDTSHYCAYCGVKVRRPASNWVVAPGAAVALLLVALVSISGMVAWMLPIISRRVPQISRQAEEMGTPTLDTAGTSMLRSTILATDASSSPTRGAILVSISPTPTDALAAISPAPAPSPSALVLYQDDFSDPRSGWSRWEDEDGGVDYWDGVYRVVSLHENIIVWGVANRSFDNLIVEVDATKVVGPASNWYEYGVLCRRQPGSLDGYEFHVTGTGRFWIAKRHDSVKYEVVGQEGYSPVIRQGSATNHLKILCDETDLALFVNDYLIDEASDSTFHEGGIAFFVMTSEDESTEIYFDNLVVTTP
jgi:hypothetical protein